MMGKSGGLLDDLLATKHASLYITDQDVGWGVFQAENELNKPSMSDSSNLRDNF